MRCHTASCDCCLRTKNCRCVDSRAMNAVPGVMQLLSKGSPSGSSSPRAAAAVRASAASRALRNRRDRCWFICAAVRRRSARRTRAHLCAGRDAVDSHVQQLGRLHHLHQVVQVREDLDHHLVLRQRVSCAARP